MNTMIQMLVVALIVLAAAVYVGRRAWSALRPKKAGGCASDCGCGDTASEKDWSKT